MITFKLMLQTLHNCVTITLHYHLSIVVTLGLGTGQWFSGPGLDTSASVDCHVHCHQFIIGNNWSQKHPARAIHEQKSSSTSGQSYDDIAIIMLQYLHLGSR